MARWLFINIANFFTALRLGLAIAIGLLALYTDGLIILILFFTTCAFLCDAIDGIIARSLRIESKFGAHFDVVADKTLAVAVLAVIKYQIWMPSSITFAGWLLIKISVYGLIFLEFWLILIGFFVYFKDLSVKTNWWGKRKMDFYAAAAVIWFLSSAAEHYWDMTVFPAMIFLVVGCLLIAGLMATMSLIEYVHDYRSCQRTKI